MLIHILGSKIPPFRLRKSRRAPCGRAFLLQVTWWKSLASYYCSHLRTSYSWGGLCVRLALQRLLGLAGGSF